MGNMAPNIAHQERPMTPDELRQALRELGMTQEGFAEMLGHAPRTGQYWASTSVPPSVATLMKLLQKRPELVDVVQSIKDEADRKHRGKR
jgi:DNA-binding transcriptional regulator YiaG